MQGSRLSVANPSSTSVAGLQEWDRRHASTAATVHHTLGRLRQTQVTQYPAPTGAADSDVHSQLLPSSGLLPLPPLSWVRHETTTTAVPSEPLPGDGLRSRMREAWNALAYTKTYVVYTGHVEEPSPLSTPRPSSQTIASSVAPAQDEFSTVVRTTCVVLPEDAVNLKQLPQTEETSGNAPPLSLLRTAAASPPPDALVGGAEPLALARAGVELVSQAGATAGNARMDGVDSTTPPPQSHHEVEPLVAVVSSNAVPTTVPPTVVGPQVPPPRSCNTEVSPQGIPLAAVEPDSAPLALQLAPVTSHRALAGATRQPSGDSAPTTHTVTVTAATTAADNATDELPAAGMQISPASAPVPTSTRTPVSPVTSALPGSASPVLVDAPQRPAATTSKPAVEVAPAGTALPSPAQHVVFQPHIEAEPHSLLTLKAFGPVPTTGKAPVAIAGSSSPARSSAHSKQVSVAAAGNPLSIVGHGLLSSNPSSSSNARGRTSHDGRNPWDPSTAPLSSAARAAAAAAGTGVGGVASGAPVSASRQVASASPSTATAHAGVSRGPSLTDIFPWAGIAEIRLRNLIREQLQKKLEAVGLAPESEPRGEVVDATGGSLSIDSTSGDKNTMLMSPLSAPAVEALSLAFERYDDKRGQLVKRRPHDPVVSIPLFLRALHSLGLVVSKDEVADTIGNLGLAVEADTVAYERFVKFVAMPLQPEDTLRAAARAAASSTSASSLPVPSRKPKVVALLEARDAKAAQYDSSRDAAWKAGGTPAPSKLSAWDLGGDDSSVTRRKPKFSVALPIQFGSPSSPFWTAVNGVEAAVMQEVRRRATVSSLAAEPTKGFEVTSRYGTTAVAMVSGAFILRRAFAFLDRRGKKEFSLSDLHATLANMGVVDPPVRPYSGMEAVRTEMSDAAGTPRRRSRGHTHDGDGEGGDAEGAIGAGVDVSSELTSPSHRLVPNVTPLSPPYTPKPPSRSGSPSSRAASPSLEVQLADAGHALVAAVFRRLHGEGDPGVSHHAATSATSGLTAADFEEGNPILAKPVTFNVFARWAMPLNGRLRKVREKLEESLRTLATMGGGAKDFARAFKRMSGGHAADENLGVKELRDVLGTVARTLSDEEVQCLIDYFDIDGNGTVDALELFSATLRGFDLRALLQAGEDSFLRSKDPYVGGPIKSPPKPMRVIFGSTS